MDGYGGYLPFADVTWSDARDGDTYAAKLSAVHCAPAEEPRSLTARINAVADMLEGRSLDVIEAHHVRAALRAMEAAFSELHEAVAGLEEAA